MDPEEFAIGGYDGGNDGSSAGVVATKDAAISNLIPEKVSECAIWLGKEPGEPCSSDATISAIAAEFHLDNTADVMEVARGRLGCDGERCVVEKVARAIQAAREDLVTRFKVKGSTGNDLLSNTQIDAVMKQFGEAFRDFYPYNFNMLDYASKSFRNGEVRNSPDTLATVLWSELYSKGFRRCGCVVNSDKYDGPGKHWMALFADSGTNTVEFFNSSGNAPAPEWVNWLVKTRIQMEEISGRPAVITRVTAIRHQKSKTECGVYSLFYIWARLNGVPAEYFTKHPVPDQFMFEFRQHIFDDPTRQKITKFSWSDFAANVKLKWEKD